MTVCSAASETPITVEITHPFHPRRGEHLVVATRRENWGEDRVMYFDGAGRLRSVLTSWTNLVDPDLFSTASSGRSWFRPDDLLRLCALLEALSHREGS